MGVAGGREKGGKVTRPGSRRHGLRAILLAGALLAAALIGAAGPAMATQCRGTDLLAGLSPARKAAMVAGVPYPDGNLWRATRGESVITLVGTYHLPDPRFAPMRARLAPILKQASALLVEASPAAQEKLKTALRDDPGQILTASGPSLADRLPRAEWLHLAEAMAARGIPQTLAARFRPWYVAMLLAVPPCAMTEMKSGAGGLDAQLVQLAEADHLQVESLEPWDTTLRVFKDLAAGDQIAMIRTALRLDDAGGDMFVTTADAYFRGAHQLLWAFNRWTSMNAPGVDKAEVAREFDTMQDILLTERNRAWIEVLARAADHRTIVAAFGAAHLGGSGGVLELLHQRGWTLTRLDG